MSSAQTIEYGMPRIYNLLKDPGRNAERTLPGDLGAKGGPGAAGGARGFAEAGAADQVGNQGSLRAAQLVQR